MNSDALTLGDIRHFSQAIAPEAAGLQVITLNDLRRRAPAYYGSQGPYAGPSGVTLGCTSPAMAYALHIDVPVFAVDPAAIEATAEQRQKWREPLQDVLLRVAREVAIHEMAHVLCHPPPYHGTCDDSALGHSMQWARLIFALTIRASVSGFGTFSPVEIISRAHGFPAIAESKLWDLFHPSLSAWGGRDIELLKAQPLPSMPTASPTRPATSEGGRLGTLPMLDGPDPDEDDELAMKLLDIHPAIYARSAAPSRREPVEVAPPQRRERLRLGGLGLIPIMSGSLDASRFLFE